MEKITAPFTDEQVEQLNRYQGLGFAHPFTCGTPEKHAEQPADNVLKATTDGWVCPGCDYVQKWAYGIMASKRALNIALNLYGSDNKKK